MAAHLKFLKLNLNKPQDFWNYVLWTDETKMEMFSHEAHLISTLLHGGGGVMI